jgi:hypothetical protein
MKIAPKVFSQIRSTFDEVKRDRGNLKEVTSGTPPVATLANAVNVAIHQSKLSLPHKDQIPGLENDKPNGTVPTSAFDLVDPVEINDPLTPTVGRKINFRI